MGANLTGGLSSIHRIKLTIGKELPTMSESEVARIRCQIEQELEAMQRGMYGLAAGKARHTFIRIQMDRLDSCRTTLAGYVGEAEATKIVYALYVESMGE